MFSLPDQNLNQQKSTWHSKAHVPSDFAKDGVISFE